jgi:dTDP-4-dehydrorhamnose 3,5-epimerase
VQSRGLAVPGAWEITPTQHSDERGTFVETYRATLFENVVGQRLDVAQVSCSVNRKGSVRGVHFADVPPSQAKYVTCPHGAILDVVVDVRVGSPTFGQWDAVRLEANQKGVYVAEGLGHAFMALTDEATVSYLCSQPYAPERERGVNPLDPALGIDWPEGNTPLLSPRDAAAPSLEDARRQGLLPSYDDCLALYAELRTSGNA